LIETELIQALKAGREDAFKELFRQFSDKVYNTAFSILQHQQEAEDITQEVFVEVFKSIKQFREDSSLTTWMYKITVSKCYDQLKKQKSKKRFAFLTSLFNEDNAIVHDKPHFEHPGILIEQKEHSKVLFYALEKLPQKQKTVFVLIKIEGLTYQEAAASMNISISATETLLFRANKNLKVLLSSYYKINIQGNASSFYTFLLML
jgi:RNA polymerase sigma factor (sigma-70 family)